MSKQTHLHSNYSLLEGEDLIFFPTKVFPPLFPLFIISYIFPATKKKKIDMFARTIYSTPLHSTYSHSFTYHIFQQSTKKGKKHIHPLTPLIVSWYNISDSLPPKKEYESLLFLLFQYFGLFFRGIPIFRAVF